MDYPINVEEIMLYFLLKQESVDRIHKELHIMNGNNNIGRRYRKRSARFVASIGYDRELCEKARFGK